MKVQVQNLRSGQLVYDEDLTDSYRVYSDAQFINNKWQVEVTTSGDYVWYFYEG